MKRPQINKIIVKTSGDHSYSIKSWGPKNIFRNVLSNKNEGRFRYVLSNKNEGHFRYVCNAREEIIPN